LLLSWLKALTKDLTVEFGKGRLQAVVDTHYRPKIGEVVSLTFDPDRLHVFSKRTDRALW
jgi:hypothetical protein